jgi:hypothetical protein
MSNEISFYFDDFNGRFQLKYCEDEKDLIEMMWGLIDEYKWDGPGVYYPQKEHIPHCGDTYYRLCKMPDSDVSDLLSFCDEIRRRFSKADLISMGWVSEEEGEN